MSRKTKGEILMPVLPDSEALQVKDIQTTQTFLVENNMNVPVEGLEIKKVPVEVIEEIYLPHQSIYLNTIIEFTNDRHHPSSLHTCIMHEDLPSYNISLHLRCLCECLLIFSELKYVKVEDLMEICNAFTYLVRSKSYATLPDEYPYTDVILAIKEKLKRVCIKVKNVDQIKFRLTQEDKIELIATRFELAQFIPKRQFSDLDFENV